MRASRGDLHRVPHLPITRLILPRSLSPPLPDNSKPAREIREGRAVLRARYGSLYDEVLRILTKHDPIEIAELPDEYEPEVDTILPRLERAPLHPMHGGYSIRNSSNGSQSVSLAPKKTSRRWALKCGTPRLATRVALNGELVHDPWWRSRDHPPDRFRACSSRSLSSRTTPWRRAKPLIARKSSVFFCRM